MGQFLQIAKTSTAKSFLPGPHLLLAYHNFKKKDSHMGQFLLGENFGFYFTLDHYFGTDPSERDPIALHISYFSLLSAAPFQRFSSSPIR